MDNLKAIKSENIDLNLFKIINLYHHRAVEARSGWKFFSLNAAHHLHNFGSAIIAVEGDATHAPLAPRPSSRYDSLRDENTKHSHSF